MYDIFSGNDNRIDTVSTFIEAIERICREIEFFAMYYICEGPRITPHAVAMRIDNMIRIVTVDDEIIMYKIRRNDDRTISYEVTKTLAKQPGPIGSWSKTLEKT